MNILFNILCKAFIAFLDILLLDYFLKINHSNVKYSKSKNMCIYSAIFIFLLLTKDIVIYNIIRLVIIMALIVIFSFSTFSTINKISFIKIIIIFYLLTTIAQLISLLFLSWLFNTRFFTFYSQNTMSFNFLFHLLANYLIYVLILVLFKNKKYIHIRHFKILSILVFICFSLIFILNNPVLFREKSISRTYIFTVVISIVALICFDRMQAKYEAEKYSQEAIIQNMKKEMSFNEQRAKRQEEIKKVNHNLINILAITQSHISDQEYEKAQDYLSKTIQSVVEEYNALNHSGIDSLDGIIQEKMSIMKENGIRYDEEISKLLHFGNIDTDNLGLIIDLALDKAIEEVKQISDEKYIRLTLQSKQTHIILHISHPIDKKQHSRFHVHNQSSHHDLASRQIETITKRYHGDIKYDMTDNELVLRIILEK